ncbi:MAG TPA: cupredoxin domain-containing protein [Anaerolineales bacterium]|nr:cupredoxin domain-containing protein [Anaerolineales bacterium]
MIAKTPTRSRFWLEAAIALVAFVVAFAPLPSFPTQPADRRFRLGASSFEYTPAILSVNPGDQVTLELVSADYVHGLYIDGYDLNLVAEPGHTETLTFIADKPGSFRFRCSVTCGALHPFMIGKLNVGPNVLLWRAIGLAATAAIAGLVLIRR